MNSSLDATEVEQVWTAGACLLLHVPAKTTSSSEIRYCLRIEQADQKPRSDFFPLAFAHDIFGRWVCENTGTGSESLAKINTDSPRILKVEFVDAKTVEMITMKGVGRLSLAS